MLAKSKLNSIETLIPQTLIDLKTIHQEFKTIIDEKENYDNMKDDNRMRGSSDKLNEKWPKY